MSADALFDPIRAHLDSLGFELVDLRRVGTPQRPILQVRVDRPDSRPGHGVTADDCAAISRSLERFLEASGAVGPRYVLEVSSPGVERPLRSAAHWRRFVGGEARVRSPVLPGRPKVRIVAVPDDDHVTLGLPDGGETTLALEDILDATLAVNFDQLGKRRH
jgi:ribosome maturation factor RimP